MVVITDRVERVLRERKIQNVRAPPVIVEENTT